MMRRYVQQERPSTQPVKRARQKVQRRKIAALTDSELQSLPQYIRDLSSPQVQTLSRSSLPKMTPIHKLRSILDKENGCVESTFINSRAAGSKTLNYKRSTKQPLYTFDDRLSRTNVIGREERTFTFRTNTYHVTEWLCHKNIVDDVNIHLLDYNAPVEAVDTFVIVKITLDNDSSSKYLLDTPAGRVCPNCKTNEYIKSDLKNMPQSYQDKHWRDKSSFGEHCEACRCISEE